MSTSVIANLLKLVGTPRDGALLRFGLGNEYLKQGEPAQAAHQFEVALQYDSNYSAAWKLFGKALADCGRAREALDAYQRGALVAEARGDKQAAREMAVFARRIERSLGEPHPDPDG